jgi:hypothetical protein
VDDGLTEKLAAAVGENQLFTGDAIERYLIDVQKKYPAHPGYLVRPKTTSGGDSGLASERHADHRARWPHRQHRRRPWRGWRYLDVAGADNGSPRSIRSR